MKNSISLLIILLFTSCTNGDNFDNVPLNVGDIVGTWQMNGFKISAGGPLPDDFTPFEGETRFVFELDGSYSFLQENEHEPYYSGRFNLVEDELVLEPDDGDVNRYSFYIELSKDTMVLSPTGPTICIEGCLYRYVRL